MQSFISASSWIAATNILSFYGEWSPIVPVEEARRRLPGNQAYFKSSKQAQWMLKIPTLGKPNIKQWLPITYIIKWLLSSGWHGSWSWQLMTFSQFFHWLTRKIENRKINATSQTWHLQIDSGQLILWPTPNNKWHPRIWRWQPYLSKYPGGKMGVANHNCSLYVERPRPTTSPPWSWSLQKM